MSLDLRLKQTANLESGVFSALHSFKCQWNAIARYDVCVCVCSLYHEEKPLKGNLIHGNDMCQKRTPYTDFLRLSICTDSLSNVLSSSVNSENIVPTSNIIARFGLTGSVYVMCVCVYILSLMCSVMAKT